MKGLTKETYEYMQLKNRTISRIRVTVEHVFARMKKFKVLYSVWRGNYDFLIDIVLAISNLHNILIDFHPMKDTINKELNF